MLRFRLGQAWKSEAAHADGPHDAFRLQLAGVDLLEDASEEPLAEIVPTLVNAAWGLAHQHEVLAQVSLPRAGLELCFARHGHDTVELVLLDMGRPARLLRPPIRLELGELVSATTACVQAMTADLSAHQPAILRTAPWVTVSKRIRALEHGQLSDWHPSAGAWAWEQFPSASTGLGFRLRDDIGRLAAFRRGTTAPLAALLCPGEIVASGGKQLMGLPFLWLFEASRRGADERWEAPGLGQVDARSVYHLGLLFALAVKTANSRLAHNHWLVALTEQCTAGLAHFRSVSDAEAHPVGHAPKRPANHRPVAKAGKLRRLNFAKRWEHESAAAGEGSVLLLGKQGPIASSPFCAQGFDREGRTLYRHVGTHGVAVNSQGQVLVANAHRLAFYEGTEASARWFRSHDGRPLGHALDGSPGIFLEATRTQGLLAHSPVTGRELWRLEPGRTLTGYPLVTPKRLYLTTDSGAFFSLSAAAGDWVFRLRSPLPFAHAPVLVGKRLYCVLTEGERTALFSAEAQSGALKWTLESRLSRPTEVSWHGGVSYLAGERDGAAWLLAVDARGRLLWERLLPSLHRPRHTGFLKSHVWVMDDHGAVAGLTKTGHASWLLGAAHEGAHASLRPLAPRGLLLLPAADTLRAVDPETGRLLAQMTLPSAPVAAQADAKLDVYVLDEQSHLTAYRVSAQLAVL